MNMTEIELHYTKLIQYLEKDMDFGPGIDIHTMLFLIGVEELGTGYKHYSKNEKIDLMHVGLCTILEPFGYYAFVGNDEDGWPHFDLKKKLPSLNERGQQNLVKQAIVDYFIENELVDSQILEENNK